MRDVSEDRRRAALERAFLHDVSGVLSALAVGANSLGTPNSETKPESVQLVKDATAALVREVRIQRLLAQSQPQHYPVEISLTNVGALLRQVKETTASHPAAKGQKISIQIPDEGLGFQTDAGVLARVLTNMVLNALEAGQPGDEIRLAARGSAETIELSVWNRQSIPDNVAMRVYQRYFSTKPGGGRGLGTYTMKLLGEKILGGSVSFVTSPAAGTTFRIRLKKAMNPEPQALSR
jgi:signal transduction histidine kinase